MGKEGPKERRILKCPPLKNYWARPSSDFRRLQSKFSRNFSTKKFLREFCQKKLKIIDEKTLFLLLFTLKIWQKVIF